MKPGAAHFGTGIALRGNLTDRLPEHALKQRMRQNR
jgi:hypothetical protein